MAKEQKTGGKRGPKSTWQEEELAFFQANRQSFLSTPSSKQANDFWPRLYKDYWDRFPGKLSGESNTEEEQEAINALVGEKNKKIKTWFRNHFKKAEKTEDVFAPFIHALQQDCIRPKPKRLRQVHAFQKHPDYKPKVVHAFETQWTDAKEEDGDLKHIKFRYDLAKNMMKNELKGDKTLEQKLKDFIEEEYEECLEDWRLGQVFEPATDPESINEARRRLAEVVQPLLERLAKYTQMSFCLLAGAPPTPGVNDKYTVRTVHYGMTKEEVPRTWNEFDKEGWNTVIIQRWMSFLNYTRENPVIERRPETLATPAPPASLTPTATSNTTVPTFIPQVATSSSQSSLEHIENVNNNNILCETFPNNDAQELAEFNMNLDTPMPPNSIPHVLQRSLPVLPEFEEIHVLGLEKGNGDYLHRNFNVLSGPLERELRRGDLWKLLVWRWGEYEEVCILQDAELLNSPKSLRPNGFEWYFKNARGTRGALDVPPGVELPSIGLQWWQWWTSMSPPSRSQDSQGYVCGRESDIDWNGYYYNGNNGLTLVLTALQWWRDLISNGGDDDKNVAEWECAVDDVLWVIENMKISLQRRKRRPNGSDSSDESDNNRSTLDGHVSKRQRIAYSPPPSAANLIGKELMDEIIEAFPEDALRQQEIARIGELGEYEVSRLSNIARNSIAGLALGLDLCPSALGYREKSGEEDGRSGDGASKKGRKTKAPKESRPPSTPKLPRSTRSSARNVNSAASSSVASTRSSTRRPPASVG